MPREPMPLGTWGPVSVTKDGSGWRAQARYRDYDGIVRHPQRRGKTESQARNRLLEALRDRKGPRTGNTLTGDSRFSAAADLWYAEIEARAQQGELAPGTPGTYESQLRLHIRPALGELRLREVTAGSIDAFLGTLGASHGPDAVRTNRTVISGVLGFAVRHGAIAMNPTRDARKITGRSRRVPRALTSDEQNRWSRQLQADADAVEKDLPDLTEWLLATGVRIGEALAVSWDEVFLPPLPTLDALFPDWAGWEEADLPYAVVNIDWKLIRVTGAGLQRVPRIKTPDGHRTLPIPRFAVQMLWRRNPTGEATGPVFPNTLGGWRDPRNTSRALREARGSKGFRWVTFHTFRKTHATILDDAGMSARIIADQMGHSKPSMTLDVYMGRGTVHPEAADALDAAHGRRRAPDQRVRPPVHRR